MEIGEWWKHDMKCLLLSYRSQDSGLVDTPLAHAGTSSLEAELDDCIFTWTSDEQKTNKTRKGCILGSLALLDKSLPLAPLSFGFGRKVWCEPNGSKSRNKISQSSSDLWQGVAFYWWSRRRPVPWLLSFALTAIEEPLSAPSDRWNGLSSGLLINAPSPAFNCSWVLREIKWKWNQIH